MGREKSTLMNMLYGLYKPTDGQIFVNGQEVSFSSPKEAIACGLGMVHQHFMLVETLTVTENIILGAEPGKSMAVDYKQATKRGCRTKRAVWLKGGSKRENRKSVCWIAAAGGNTESLVSSCENPHFR